MIKISNFKRDGEKVEFDVEAVELKLLNAFRRTLMSRVPVMACEKVTIYQNDSILNDENLTHRIGLMPVSTDLKTYNPRCECKCKGEGCARCTCVLTVDVTGPKTVYSGDFSSQDENVKPVYETIPLVKLLPDQRLKLEAEAVIGYGSEHVKWQPGLAGYEIGDKNRYHVKAESYGPLQVDELLMKSFEVVDEKLKQLKKKV